MERARKALLIGVGRAPATDGLLEPLDEVVEADLRLMSSVLDGIGYEVEVLPDADRGQIQRRLYQVACDAPPDSTLLLYFTGHGVRVGGSDYLVPADAEPSPEGGWEWPYLDSLLPANVSQLLNKCRAGTVLWLVDACRTDLGDDEAAFGNAIDNGPPKGGFAVLTACSTGEHSGYSAEGSFFTRGLAHALGPLTSARTVEEVFELARGRTAAAARRHGLSQTALIRYGTNGEAATRETAICEGRPLLETWLRAVRATPLWDLVRPEDQASVPGFQEHVAALVERCARMLHLAQGRLFRPDPWSDEAFPVRLVEKRLPLVLPETRQLSAMEVAFLVVAPFLWEAAWADRLSQAVDVDPYRTDRQPEAEAHRRHFEQVCDQHARIVRKVDQCRARDRTEDETAVVMWLVHRWIADRFETDDEPMPVSLAETFAGDLGVASDRVHEVAELLCAVASAIGFDELPDGVVASGRVSVKAVLPAGPQPLRIRPLAALLRLAAVLSVDVRTFPEILAEHLAVTDPVLPEHVTVVAHGLSWEREDSALHLDAPCPHQAVHAALAEVVEEADQLVTRIRDRAVELPGPEADLLTDVPKRVTARALRPARTSGRHKPYEVPLLRFHLAQAEVRELLMGEQLYGGDPTLALRELYQNAMDACRYRAMRWTYLTSSGARPVEWSGQITFTQGEDERGRYVECRDNGVGMSEELLTHTFTRAGSRFERSKSFRREQSRWLRHDRSLRLYPNSRFGIGVFSYFMLADEMTIVTRQVSPEGIPAEHALRVDIPSSGSLFRIRHHTGPDDGLAEGGTRVRLYLREGAATAGLSCTRVLRGLVRVSEFRVSAVDGDGVGHRWEPGVLQSLSAHSVQDSVRAIPRVLWWVAGEGAILCDGVMTNQKPFGYVLNLSGPYAGKLSVSRTQLQDYDHGWAEKQWRSGAEVLSRWPGLTTTWTAMLEQRSLHAAQALDEEWRGKDVRVARKAGHPLSLDDTGWFYLDRQVDTGNPGSRAIHRIQPWRRAVLGGPTGLGHAAPPQSLTGHPVPSPGDARLVEESLGSWPGFVAYSAENKIPLAALLRRARRLRIADPSLSPPPAVDDTALAWIPTESDAALVQALDARPARRETALAPDALSAIVLASRKHGIPLGELVQSLARLAPLHGLAIPSPPEHHVDRICTAADIRRLFSTTNQPLQSRVSGPGSIRLHCHLTGIPVSEVLDSLSEFSWLGWTAPSPSDMASLPELDEESKDTLNHLHDWAEEGRLQLGWAATIYIAGTLQIPLADAERRVGKVAEALGRAHEPHYGDGCVEGSLVPSSDTARFVDYLTQHIGVVMEDGIDPDDLGFAMTNRSTPADHIDHLNTMGVPLPSNHRLVQLWRTLNLRSRYVLSGKNASDDETDYPAPRLTSDGLLNAARHLQEPLDEVWKIASEHAPTFGFEVPPLPAALADRRPTWELCSALCDFGEPGYIAAPRWRRLSPSALAEYASALSTGPATAYEKLGEFRALGALVPELTVEELADFPDDVPDDWDLVALSTGQRLADPDSAYTALELVSIAARLGERVSETACRIRPYLPLLPTRSELPAAPDIVPCWQDLTLLARHFDGRLPSVEGDVPARHVALAAAATGEDEAWITGRLRLYAEMFNLNLPDNGDKSESESCADD
ncbi:caspase family protein [Streptomyces sp. NPDC002677]|uniref:HD domain-containing protein n=1 Tax=Streptomyces sp. NPDC002677 TaxID=3154774 RepID=UPI0033209A4D